MLILKSTCQTSSDLFHFLFYLFLHIDIFLECVTFSYIDGYKKKGNPFNLRIKRMECLNANHSEHKQNKLIWEKSIKKKGIHDTRRDYNLWFSIPWSKMKIFSTIWCRPVGKIEMNQVANKRSIILIKLDICN